MLTLIAEKIVISLDGRLMVAVVEIVGLRHPVYQ